MTQDKTIRGVSLELAQKMAKLGWVYKTERYWWKVVQDKEEWRLTYKDEVPVAYFVEEHKTVINKRGFYCYPAPDAIEIGEELPAYIILNDYECNLYIGLTPNNDWYVHYHSYNGKEGASGHDEENMTEALGKMWCYLKESKLI